MVKWMDRLSEQGKLLAIADSRWYVYGRSLCCYNIVQIFCMIDNFHDENI